MSLLITYLNVIDVFAWLIHTQLRVTFTTFGATQGGQQGLMKMFEEG